MPFKKPARPALASMIGNPILLHASLATLEAGQSRSPNVVSLRHKYAMVIREIRVSCRMSITSSSYSPGDLPNCVAAPVIGLSLSLLGQPLMAAPVSVGLLDKIRDHGIERETSNDIGYIYSTYVWRLSRPLLVPAGAILQPTFTHFGHLGKSYTLNISYLGNELHKNFAFPRKLMLPWISPWTPPVVSLSGTESVYTSNEKDLGNPHGGPLYVERLMGRLYRTRYQTGYVDFLHFFEAEATDTNAIWRQSKVRLSDSLGNRVVRADAYFYNVFDFTSHTIELAHVLPAGAFYSMTFKCGGTAVANNTALATFSLNGWREVSL